LWKQITNMSSSTIFTACGPPPNLPHTSLVGNQFRIGSRLKYSCIQGYEMTSSVDTQVECTEDGSWTSTALVCQGR